MSSYFAGHPKENFVLTIFVKGSNISKVLDPSTEGSHSLRSSGVASTAFQTSRSATSSVTGISTMTRYSSPLFVDFLCTRMPSTSESDDAFSFPFPFVLVLVPSRTGTGTRFQLDDCAEVRWCLNEESASVKALDHDSRSLEVAFSFRTKGYEKHAYWCPSELMKVDVKTQSHSTLQHATLGTLARAPQARRAFQRLQIQ